MSYDQSTLYRTVVARLMSEPGTTLTDIAGRLNVNRRTLQQVIMASDDGRLRTLRDKLLVAKVCTLLCQQPTSSIKEIAFAAGYMSPRSFARALKRACGAAPHELRKFFGGGAMAAAELGPGCLEIDGFSMSCSQELPVHNDDSVALSVTLSRSHIELLTLYREFSGAEHEDIIASAILHMFESHGTFWGWLLQRRIVGLYERTTAIAAKELT